MKHVAFLCAMLLFALAMAAETFSSEDMVIEARPLEEGESFNEDCVYLLASNGQGEQMYVVQKLDYSSSYNNGYQDAATMHSTSGWMLGGVGSGLLLGLIGTGIIALAASGSEPGYIPENVDPMGYRAGYLKKSKSRNSGAAAVGGLIGTGVIVLLVLASY